MRFWIGRLFFVLLLGLPLARESRAQDMPQIELKLIASGFKQPTHILYEPDFPDRLLVVEQAGRVMIIEKGQRLDEPLVDITSQVESGGEKGLLSLAFHPQFRTNAKFYVFYSRKIGKLQSVVSEFRITPGTGKVDLDSERRLLLIDKPFENHNGGQLAFGKDGFLYVGTGDGGGAFDPQGNGQNTFSLLGKILRIDVDHGDPYVAPLDNPYIQDKKGFPEIWAFGLRNPWRFSFDRKTSDLWAADVGQNAWEEIDIITKGGNYGWNVFEGSNCLRVRFECLGFYESPIWTYGRTEGQSVTGGFVYRGKSFPELDGLYIYGDYVSGRIWGLRYENKAVKENKLLLDSGKNISTFGEDEDGELYLADHVKGEIYQIVVKGKAVVTTPTTTITVTTTTTTVTSTTTLATVEVTTTTLGSAVTETTTTSLPGPK